MIYILLPCYNEYKNLKIIIKKINNLSINLKYNFKIIIVNDGSTDETGIYINKIKKISKNKIIYIKHKKNLGLNNSMFSGFKKFIYLGRINDLIITLDSDNTHPISLFPRLIKLIKNKKIDLVIASRFQNGSKVIGLSFFRKLLSEVARIVFKLTISINNVEDYTCNFRAYSFKIVKKSKLINKKFFLNKDFSIAADLLVNLKKNCPNIKIAEIPLILRYDKKIGESKMKILKNIFKTLFLILKNII